MRYISYWIPTTNSINFETQIDELTSNKSTNNISDNIEEADNKLHLHIKKNKDIYFTYLGNEFFLTHIKSYDNGILIYSFRDMPTHVEEILDIQIYHYLKSFFHLHTCHNKEEDALLQAVITIKKPEYDEILIHYCRTFKRKFEEHYNNIVDYSSVDILLDKYKTKQTKVYEVIESIAKIQRKIHQIETELVFFEFLSSTITDDTLKDFYLREHKNDVIKFTILYQEYEILDNQVDTEYSRIINKHQVLLGILGIALGTILGGIGWYYGYHGATETNLLNLNKVNIKNIQEINNNILNIPCEKVHSEINKLNKIYIKELNTIEKTIQKLDISINKCQSKKPHYKN